jgi:hypothetical protein
MDGKDDEDEGEDSHPPVCETNVDDDTNTEEDDDEEEPPLSSFSLSW